MNYQNVSCFDCKIQCTDIPEKLRVMTEGEPINGCQCLKCRTIYTAGEGIIDGRMVAMLEAQLMEEVK